MVGRVEFSGNSGQPIGSIEQALPAKPFRCADIPQQPVSTVRIRRLIVVEFYMREPLIRAARAFVFQELPGRGSFVFGEDASRRRTPRGDGGFLA
ncbi:hypothetical protein [Nocardia vulneris]|uniref:hypothetical protein n=1 Tax=Nocardia vulneris TaxID=1141657 RepID=UPI000AD8EB02|nr:hypothetical protein [Nocardia vulneris]